MFSGKHNNQHDLGNYYTLRAWHDQVKNPCEDFTKLVYCESIYACRQGRKLTLCAAEQKRGALALPGTESVTSRERSGTPASSSRSGTVEPISAVPHHL